MKTLTHIAMRLSDETYNLPHTVNRHNLVSASQGAVWLGKPDRGLTPKLMATLNEQIEAGYPTHLFIVPPPGNSRAYYRAEMQRVSLRSPQDKKLIPAFYRELKILSRMKTWFEIGELERVSLAAVPGLKEAHAAYIRTEKLILSFCITSMHGYFELSQEASGGVFSLQRV